MADKKITALNERLLPINGADLLLLVANTVPAAYATNYKVQVKNFLTNCQIALSSTQTSSAFKITANVVANTNDSIMVSASTVVLDAGNTVATACAAYGSVIVHTISSNSLSRGYPPVAYLGIAENAGANTDFKTTYLLEAGVGGADISEDSVANAGVILSPTGNAAAATHTARVRINGTDYWILLSDVGPE